ncbi:hypothetical protein ACLOJK_018747, partial [Asimina triloba]
EGTAKILVEFIIVGFGPPMSYGTRGESGAILVLVASHRGPSGGLTRQQGATLMANGWLEPDECLRVDIGPGKSKWVMWYW